MAIEKVERYRTDNGLLFETFEQAQFNEILRELRDYMIRYTPADRSSTARWIYENYNSIKEIMERSR